jgi:hypothetical protein
LYAERKELYKQLAAARKSLIFTYVTGDRRGLETQIDSDAVELIGDLLDHYEGAKRKWEVTGHPTARDSMVSAVQHDHREFADATFEWPEFVSTWETNFARGFD